MGKEIKPKLGVLVQAKKQLLEHAAWEFGAGSASCV
jgi:hypothetical protein